MSGYQRFIAYVYEYQKGKKTENCGFLKVEIKSSSCRIEIHLHCPGIPPEIEAQIYGFFRKDGLMNGILLGSCHTSADMAECVIECDAENPGNTGIPFKNISGIVIQTQAGGFYGTEWDDQPIRPDNFREFKPIESEKNVARPQEDTSENPDAPDTPPSPSISAPTEERITPVPPFPPQEKSSSKEKAPTNVEAVSAVSVRQPYSFSGKEFTPFDDTDFLYCWKIHPNDLIQFSSGTRTLRNNRFLQYGFYHFGHLLLGVRPGGKYILGVPGSYDQQERFMANMFGFPYFRESRTIQLPRSRGGYWCRSVDSPNFH